jgi:pre-mRNA-splicing factor CDC5/CEF1
MRLHLLLISLLSIYFSDDNVMMEARNLRNMTNAQTPLLGDENTPLHAGSAGGSGFEGATPCHQVAFTPNPLSTPMRDPSIDPSSTPRPGLYATPLRNPMHDNLSINLDDYTADTPIRRTPSAKLAQSRFHEPTQA